MADFDVLEPHMRLAMRTPPTSFEYTFLYAPTEVGEKPICYLLETWSGASLRLLSIELCLATHMPPPRGVYEVTLHILSISERCVRCLRGYRLGQS